MILAKLSPIVGAYDVIDPRRNEFHDITATRRLGAVPVDDDEGGEGVILTETVEQGDLTGLDQLWQMVLGSEVKNFATGFINILRKFSKVPV